LRELPSPANKRLGPTARCGAAADAGGTATSGGPALTLGDASKTKVKLIGGDRRKLTTAVCEETPNPRIVGDRPNETWQCLKNQHSRQSVAFIVYTKP
jgi:hypothetical protein